MVNLMSNDVNRFELASYYLSHLLIAPLQLIIATITLYYFIGPSSLAGLALILILIPIQGSSNIFYSLLCCLSDKLADQMLCKSFYISLAVSYIYNHYNLYTIIILVHTSKSIVNCLGLFLFFKNYCNRVPDD